MNVFHYFDPFQPCFKFHLWNFNQNFVLNHCGAIGAGCPSVGRLYDWFSEYRLRAAGREDILEKVGRLGGKDEWLLNPCWLRISSSFHSFCLAHQQVDTSDK